MWSILPTPNPPSHTLNGLESVSCTSARACTAVGTYGSQASGLVERWNGSRWAIQPTPTPPIQLQWDYRASLSGVSCTTAQSCTAVGYSDGEEWVLHWNGVTWSTQPAAPPAADFGLGWEELNSVSCVSTDMCMAVGDWYGGSTADGGLVERWNGQNWSHTETDSDLDGVSCTSTRACTAVGGGGDFGAIAQRWNGSRWSDEPTPNADNNYLAGVSCISRTTCIAVGNTGDAAPLAEIHS